MKMFTKLALVSSMAISANAMAMQAMDDAALSSATGQDGITMTIDTVSGISIDKLYIHDNDGLTALGGITVTPANNGPDGLAGTGDDVAATTRAAAIGDLGFGGTGTDGAISIDSLSISKQVSGDTLLTLDIDSDAGTGTDGAFLNIAASVAAIDVSIGSIGVGKSGTYSDTTGMRGATDVNEIITGFDLSLGAISANVQLGATPQGAMILIDSALEGGLDITNLGINDAAGGGKIFLDKIAVRGDGANGDVEVKAGISVTSNGLEIENKSTQGLNVYVAGVRLGDVDTTNATTIANTASIGDIEIQGLNTGGSTITIRGH